MRKEVKDILGLLLFVLPVFAVMFFGWLHSPMSTEVKSRQRAEAFTYLVKTYWYRDPVTTSLRQDLMRYYGFTEDDVKPSLTHYNQNLGGLKGR